MSLWVFLVLFFSLTSHSGATYCVCKDGLSDAALQKSLDYACGAGADCTPILQNGACYQPNTVKDHCSYAVNSYFQRKGQATGTCDFAGTAMTSASPPAGVASTCVYPASASNAGTGNSTAPSTNTPTTTTPTSTPPSTTTPSTTTTPPSTTTTPSTATPTTTTTPSPTVFGTGLGPSGTAFDNSNSGVDSLKASSFFFPFLTLWLAGMILLWV